jgi:hypothetical protein
MLAAPGVQFFAVVALFILRQEHGNELVAAFSDLASHLLEAHVMPEPYQGVMPSQRVEIDRIDQGTVNVEDCGLWHSTSSMHEQDFDGGLAAPAGRPLQIENTGKGFKRPLRFRRSMTWI